MSSDVLAVREALNPLREILFANVVMAAEIPAPTGDEWRLTRFLSDRFTESGLDNIAKDEAGNVAGVLSGPSATRNLLVAAHLDKIWSENDDHTVSVGVGEMSGRGIADNSLGIAALASLPLILRTLGIELKSNLILLGTTRSFGRGDIGGMRFFLENSEREIESALCLEGINLGRVSYASLGMARGEICVASEMIGESNSGVVGAIADCVDALLAIDRREGPEATILVGGLEAGAGFNIAPILGTIRFEVRSESASKVAELEKEIIDTVNGLSSQGGFSIGVEMVGHRKPGRLRPDHAMVRKAETTLAELGVKTHDEPSLSELAALLEKRIPALTLGITVGKHRHSPKEAIELEPIFAGLVQIVSMLQYMDRESPEF